MCSAILAVRRMFEPLTEGVFVVERSNDDMSWIEVFDGGLTLRRRIRWPESAAGEIRRCRHQAKHRKGYFSICASWGCKPSGRYQLMCLRCQLTSIVREDEARATMLALTVRFAFQQINNCPVCVCICVSVCAYMYSAILAVSPVEGEGSNDDMSWIEVFDGGVTLRRRIRWPESASYIT